MRNSVYGTHKIISFRCHCMYYILCNNLKTIAVSWLFEHFKRHKVWHKTENKATKISSHQWIGRWGYFIALINRNRLVDIVNGANDDDDAAAATAVVVFWLGYFAPISYQFLLWYSIKEFIQHTDIVRIRIHTIRKFGLNMWLFVLFLLFLSLNTLSLVCCNFCR